MTREEAIKRLKELRSGNWWAFEDPNEIDITNEALDMAIEALQGGDADMTGTSPYMQPSPDSGVDLIGRADAIKAVAEHFSFDDGCSNIYKDIDYYKGIAEHILKNVPSALPSAEAKWIPCSERLPEKDDLVLATVWDAVVIAWRNLYGKWESAEDMYEKGDVTAWMPLPKPYREDGE